MQTLITIKNYRCFSDANPARIKIRKGFTAFIGVNNSGKSTLLKFFYEFRHIFQSLASMDGIINALTSTSQVFNLPEEILHHEDIFCNSNERPISIEFQVYSDFEEIEYDEIVKLNVVILRDKTYTVSINLGNLEVSNKTNHDDIRCDETKLVIFQGGYPDDSTELYYLIEFFNNLSRTLYIGPFRNAINVSDLTNPARNYTVDMSYLNYFDIKIGRNFMLQWRQFKNGSDRNQKKATIEVTNDIKRIFNFEQLEIHYPNDDQSMEIIINGKYYNLSELGSGLAQFIVVLFNAAMHKPSYILIDEPELNLHPALQLDFLTTLGKYASEGTLFATHSMGLARASADYIYTVRPTSKGSEVREFEDNPRLTELLGELSFSAYREFGFDKVLLVEGSSEIKTIQQFLRKYKQDQHILLLPLGGSSLIKDESKEELEEIKRISDKIYALIDSEISSAGQALEPARKAFFENCKKIGIDCHVLERRATENYFTDKAIKLVLGEKYSELQPYQKLKDAKFNWGKSENWRIAKEMTLEELEATDLGKFLKEKVCNL